MKRAIEFYTPLLGKPDLITPTQAYFGLRDPKFILDNTGLYGFADVKKNLSNGYAILYVKELQKEIARLKKNGVEFLDNTDTKPKSLNEDSLALIKDIDGNVIVILERNFAAEEGATLVTGFEQKSHFINAAKEIAEAWMKKDAKTVTKWNGEDGTWFDISELLNRGVQEGKDCLAKDLKNYYWKNLGFSTKGIVGEWNASNIKENTLGDYTIVSYLRTLTGNGSHPFKRQSQITHIFDSETTLLFTFINNSTVQNAYALELDYTGHPVVNLKKAEKFYSEQLELGEPYTDEEWRGYWSNNTVYGIFTSYPEDDGIPVKNKTNGYVSFWIHSAQEVYDYLKDKDVNFPVISSVNEVKGIDKQPGYVQVVSTDSEGNLVIFTEYTGKKK